MSQGSLPKNPYEEESLLSAVLEQSCGRMSHFADQKVWELFMFTRDMDSRSKLKTH